MAESLTFNGAGFTLTTNEKEGTEELGVVRLSATERNYLLKNISGSTIEGLEVSSDDLPLRLEVSSDNEETLAFSTFDLGSAADELIIGGETTEGSRINTGGRGDKFTSGGNFIDSSLDMARGRDTAEFSVSSGKVVAQRSSIDMGAGNDELTFNGNVRRTEVDLGKGEDFLVFGGNINRVAVNLGSDNQVDQINIAEGAKIRGLTITGATENDILFIGSAEYSYEGGTKWVNVDDPNDVRNF